MIFATRSTFEYWQDDTGFDKSDLHDEISMYHGSKIFVICESIIRFFNILKKIKSNSIFKVTTKYDYSLRRNFWFLSWTSGGY